MADVNSKNFSNFFADMDIWQEVTVFSTIFISLSWLIPWYQWFIFPEDIVPPPSVYLTMVGAILSSYLITRGLTILRIDFNISRFVWLALLFVWTWLGLNLMNPFNQSGSYQQMLTQKFDNLADLRNIVPDDFVIFVVVLFLWWTGISMARVGVHTHGILGRIRQGFVMFVFYGVGSMFIEGDLPFTYVFIYLFASLLGLGSSKIGMISRFRGGLSVPFTRSWFSGMFIGVLGTVVGAVGLGSVFAGKFGFSIYGIFQGFLYFLSFIIISPILFLIQLFAKEQSTTLLPTETPTPTLVNFLTQAPTPNPENLEAEEIAGSQLDIEQIIFIGIIAVAVLLIFVAFNRLRDQDVSWKRMGEGVRYQESEMSGSVWDAFKNFLSDPLGQIRGWQNRYSLRRLNAQKIRRMYAEFLNLCIDLQVPRKEAETPLEFIPNAVLVMPDLENEIRLLTDAYLKVRYGEIPESADQLTAVENAWETLKEGGKKIVKDRKRASRK